LQPTDPPPPGLEPEPVCLRPAGLAGGEPGAPAALLAAGGRIRALGAGALAAGAPELALPGLWLAPAPLDAHVHLCLGAGPEGPAGALAAWRAAGVAAVRDLGNPPAKPAPAQAGEPPPLCLASGPGLGAAGEGGSWLAHKLAGPEEFARAAARAARPGGWVKLFATGLLDFGRPGRVEHPLAVSGREMAAAVEAAHEAGARVAVHASGEAAVLAAARAGADSVEHGFFLGRGALERLAESGAAWSPTLAAVEAHAADPEGRHAPGVRANLKRIAGLQAQALRLGHELGVRLVAGSDAGSYGLPHGRALWLELEAWLAAGLPPGEVFAACTGRAAQAVGLGGELGVLAPGARAWLLACRENPAANPLALAQPVWRSFQGG
jgi:imidazolonepropionase-like amidohydrolase